MLAVTALALSLAGCVAMPSGGPVLPYTITPGPGVQGQRYMQIIPRPPGPGWDPTEIVRGFLTASASFANGQKVAREYLTPAGNRRWKPTWTATVFKGSGPAVGTPEYPAGGKGGKATIEVSGQVQAHVAGSGAYAFPSAAGKETQATFQLIKSGGQWRISLAPNERLLTSVEFSADYQLRNLYFLTQTEHYLVPDPVYVPLQTTPADLTKGLVSDLIKPPDDWLKAGTRTAFPAGTKLLGDVTLEGGAAEVNLGGSVVRATDNVRSLVFGQLLSTLSGTAQGQPLVESVELLVDGKPWIPANSQAQGIPNQHTSSVSTPTGASPYFYNLDSTGEVWRRATTTGAQATKVAKIGPGYSAIAVSPDGRYLAALKGGTLFAGQLGRPLVKRAGTGYTSMSWDPDDDLWAVESGAVVMLRGNLPQAEPVPVDVVQTNGIVVTRPVTAIQVAPDGVRAALVIGGSSLAFGAITQPVQGAGRVGVPGIMEIVLSPFAVPGVQTSFSGVTWYGPDNVITLGTQRGTQEPAITEYPVNGGQSTIIPSQAGIVSVSASAGSELIAGTKDGGLLADASTSGSWTAIGRGLAPVYPG